MYQARVIIALVKVLEDGGEDFWLFVGQIDSFAMGFEELASTASGKERRDTQDILVGSKEPLVGTHAEGYNSRSKVAKSEEKKMAQVSKRKHI